MEKLWNFFSGDLYEPCEEFGIQNASKPVVKMQK